MKTIARIAAVSAIIICTFALGALTATIVVHHHDAATANTTSVNSYNDGWATSKQDDCQQGFQGACQWLNQN